MEAIGVVIALAVFGLPALVVLTIVVTIVYRVRLQKAGK